MNQKIYAIRAETGLVKLGRSIDPKRRMASLQSTTRDRLSLEAVVEAPPAVEKGLHFIFRDRRVRGEWFDISRNEVVGIFRKIRTVPKISVNLVKVHSLYGYRKVKLEELALAQDRTLLSLFLDGTLLREGSRVLYRQHQPDNNGMCFFAVSLSPELGDALREEAYQRKMCIVDFFRLAVKNELTRNMP